MISLFSVKIGVFLGVILEVSEFDSLQFFDHSGELGFLLLWGQSLECGNLGLSLLWAHGFDGLKLFDQTGNLGLLLWGQLGEKLGFDSEDLCLLLLWGESFEGLNPGLSFGRECFNLSLFLLWRQSFEGLNLGFEGSNLRLIEEELLKLSWFLNLLGGKS